MTNVFIELISMSHSESYLILAIIVLRLVMKKAPKRILCMLWILVGIHLICPITVGSVLSLVPSNDSVSSTIRHYSISSSAVQREVEVNRGPIRTEELIEETSNMKYNTYINIATVVWIGGFALLMIYSFLSYRRLKRQTATAIPYEDHIYESDQIDSPFILGTIKPRIYIPSYAEEYRNSIIAHERAHLARKDHWVKPIGYTILALYWFHPLCWIAYVLLCRDIELACDERVLSEMKLDQRCNYFVDLLHCAIKRQSIRLCPLAFGEVAVKERVQNILNYKKPRFWIILVSLVMCAIVSVCFFTSPVDAVSVDDSVWHQAIVQHYMNDCGEKMDFVAEGHTTLGVEKK